MPSFPLVNHNNYFQLKESLNFLHVQELKELATRLSLVDRGKKGQIIARILHFIQTGEKLAESKIPAISCAKSGQIILLKQNALMLKGSYKNDLKTRLFFKKLIGEHFHFTAFGIDWLNERWMSGKPPTYQEFANMWQVEHQRRKEMPTNPKEEWAYINFTQRFLREFPDSSHKTIINAWEIERQKHKSLIEKILILDSKHLYQKI